MATRTSKPAPPTSRGMKKKDLEPGAGFGETTYIKKGDTVPVQFYHEPDDFLVFREHQWDEDRKWFFVPCIGEGCVLCDDESDNRSKTSYQWAAQVYNIKERKAQVLKGGKDLGNRIWYRYERKPSLFVKRVLEITKFATQPITHEVAPGEDKPVDLTKIKPIDLDEWRNKQLHAYYGEDIPTAADLEDDEDEFEDTDDDLEDDDDLDDDDDTDDEDLDDDEDDDEFEDTDDDDEDEEEEPAPVRKAKPKTKPKPAAAATRGKTTSTKAKTSSTTARTSSTSKKPAATARKR